MLIIIETNSNNNNFKKLIPNKTFQSAFATSTQHCSQNIKSTIEAANTENAVYKNPLPHNVKYF